MLGKTTLAVVKEYHKFYLFNFSIKRLTSAVSFIFHIVCFLHLFKFSWGCCIRLTVHEGKPHSLSKQFMLAAGRQFI